MFCGLLSEVHGWFYVHYTYPLTTFTQKSKMFEWSVACEKSFQLLKDRFTSTLVWTLQKGTKGFVVYCDESRVDLGCVLMQHGKVVAYASRGT